MYALDGSASIPLNPVRKGAASEPDQALIATLFARHADKVRRFAAALVGESAADDVVSETFVVALRRTKDIPEQALPWLLGVARFVAMNHGRAERRRRALEARLSLRREAQELQRDQPDVVDRIACINALQKLSESDRAILLIWAWTDVDPVDAATVLKCSITAYHVRLHRAKSRLRAAIGGSHE